MQISSVRTPPLSDPDHCRRHSNLPEYGQRHFVAANPHVFSGLYGGAILRIVARDVYGQITANPKEQDIECIHSPPIYRIDIDHAL